MGKVRNSPSTPGLSNELARVLTNPELPFLGVSVRLVIRILQTGKKERQNVLNSLRGYLSQKSPRHLQDMREDTQTALTCAFQVSLCNNIDFNWNCSVRP